MHKGREYSSELIIDSRIGAIGPDGVNSKRFVEEGGKDDGGSEHLPSAFVLVPVDLDKVGLHQRNEYTLLLESNIHRGLF